MPASSQDAQYVWFDEAGRGRNRFAAFRYVLDLRTRAAEGHAVCIFADTAYHLYVNGAFVDAGPARFDPRFPLYDTHDLAPYLRKGRNVIAVLARHYGDVTFLSRLARAGMIAWGSVRDGRRTVTIRTPEGWKVRQEEGFDATAPNYSFTLPAIEVYDQARGLGRWTEPDFDDSDWAARRGPGRPAALGRTPAAQRAPLRPTASCCRSACFPWRGSRTRRCSGPSARRSSRYIIRRRRSIRGCCSPARRFSRRTIWT